MRVYTSIVTSMLSGMSPEQILSFKPSEEAQTRVSELLWLLNSGTISPDERAELTHHMEVDSIIRLAKAKAKKHMGSSLTL